MPDTSAIKTADAPDTPFDISLRPPMFEEFVGQEKVCERLELMVEASKQRGDVLDHILLSGPPGLGKTTLAYGPRGRGPAFGGPNDQSPLRVHFRKMRWWKRRKPIKGLNERTSGKKRDRTRSFSPG